VLRVLAVATLCACTAHQAYDGIQQGKRNECARLPQSQQAECIDDANVSFEEYQRRRKQATGQ
jgi:hypothetical protein